MPEQHRQRPIMIFNIIRINPGGIQSLTKENPNDFGVLEEGVLALRGNLYPLNLGIITAAGY